MRTFLLLIGSVAVLGLAGCSGSGAHAARAPLSERERDSVLAKTNLPGASTVGRAMDASDDQARRAAATNAQIDSLPR